MKILVISDSHGNIANLAHVMGFAKKYGFEAVIHAGDWNTIESVETVLETGIPLYTVLGNADIDPELGKRLKVKGKSFAEDFLEVEVGERKIGITHKPTDNKKFFAGKKLDIIFNGHYHSKDESKVLGTKVVRPGATVTGINFAVYDTISGKIEFVEEKGS